ncbi:MAG: hypothetical protein ACKOSS_06590 [Planctomycetia bacterium]
MPSRLSMLCVLAVALVLGLAPWRVVASAEAGHGSLWLPGLEHAHDREHAEPHAGSCPGERAAGTCGHEHPASPMTSEPHCHCDDAPAVPGLSLARVVLAPPLCLPGTGLGAVPKAVPAHEEGGPQGPRPRPPRVACEEEPVVLLR